MVPIEESLRRKDEKMRKIEKQHVADAQADEPQPEPEVRQTPHTVKRVGPQHLIASEPISISAKMAQANERKE